MEKEPQEPRDDCWHHRDRRSCLSPAPCLLRTLHAKQAPALSSPRVERHHRWDPRRCQLALFRLTTFHNPRDFHAALTNRTESSFAASWELAKIRTETSELRQRHLRPEPEEKAQKLQDLQLRPQQSSFSRRKVNYSANTYPQARRPRCWEAGSCLCGWALGTKGSCLQ